MDTAINYQQLQAGPDKGQHDQATTSTPLRLDLASGDFSFWTAQGEAFLAQPVRGDKFVTSRARPGLISLGGDYWDGPYPVGNLNNYWISTDDHLTGSLTSDEFPITAQFPWFSFLISGTDDITVCFVALLVKATPTNAQKFTGKYP